MMIDGKPPSFTIALSKRCQSVNEGGLLLGDYMEFHEAANIFPMMVGEEMDRLVDSIRKGYKKEFPIFTYEGKILDGRNRYTACLKTGTDPIFQEWNGDSPVEFVVAANYNRRDLTSSQRAVLALEIEKQLAVEAKKRLGHNQHTSSFQLFEKTEEPIHAAEQAAKMIGTNRQYVSDAKNIAAKSPDMLNKVRSGEMTIPEAKKEIRKQEHLQARRNLADAAKNVEIDDRWNIYHASIETWQAPRRYDFIITDPPYPKEYLSLYETLAMRAMTWLKPGGLLVAMCGQSYLDQIISMMSKHMKYYWTACYLTPGQPTPLRQRQVNTSWKPLLMFVNDDYKGKIFGDVYKSDQNEKDFHKWGQSVSGMTSIISQLCLPGQYILDPFVGSGTTGIAAIQHGCFFDGIDNDIESVNIAKGRINDTAKTRQ